MRASADEAAEEISEHLATEQARAREEYARLAEAIEAHAAKLERVRAEAQALVDAAAADRDAAIARAEADKAVGIAAAGECVELRGFEPLTPSMPWRCATSCATAP